jgi:hypothetical protein
VLVDARVTVGFGDRPDPLEGDAHPLPAPMSQAGPTTSLNACATDALPVMAPKDGR